MRFFMKEGILDLSEIEEALAIVKMRKEKGSLQSLTGEDDAVEVGLATTI